MGSFWRAVWSWDTVMLCGASRMRCLYAERKEKKKMYPSRRSGEYMNQRFVTNVSWACRQASARDSET